MAKKQISPDAFLLGGVNAGYISQWKRLSVHWRGKKALINNKKYTT
jgi:hypothetical protein